MKQAILLGTTILAQGKALFTFAKCCHSTLHCHIFCSGYVDFLLVLAQNIMVRSKCHCRCESFIETALTVFT